VMAQSGPSRLQPALRTCRTVGTGDAGRADDPPKNGTGFPRIGARRNFWRSPVGVNTTAPGFGKRQNTGRPTAESHHDAAPHVQEFSWRRTDSARCLVPDREGRKWFLRGSWNRMQASCVGTRARLLDRGVATTPARSGAVDTPRCWASLVNGKRRVFSQGSGVSGLSLFRRGGATWQHSSRAARRSGLSAWTVEELQ
jgi:hypothetical protein